MAMTKAQIVDEIEIALRELRMKIPDTSVLSRLEAVVLEYRGYKIMTVKEVIEVGLQNCEIRDQKDQPVTDLEHETGLLYKAHVDGKPMWVHPEKTLWVVVDEAD